MSNVDESDLSFDFMLTHARNFRSRRLRLLWGSLRL